MHKVLKLGKALPILILAACVANPNTMPVGAVKKSVTQIEEQQVRTFLGEQTRDPEAARVRNLSGYNISNGDRVICGEFNGKNAYGGYVGYNAFYIRLRGNTVKASAWGENQAYAAAKTCSDASAGRLMIQPD